MAVRAIHSRAGSALSGEASNDWADHSIANDFEGACTLIEMALRASIKLSPADGTHKIHVACEASGGRELVVCSFPTSEVLTQLCFGAPQLHAWFGQRRALNIVAPRYASELFGGISRSTSSMLLSAARAALKEVSDHFPHTSSLVLCPVLEPSRQLFIGTGSTNTPKAGPGITSVALTDSRASSEWLPRNGLCPSPGQLHRWLHHKVNPEPNFLSNHTKGVHHFAEVASVWKLPAVALLPVSNAQGPLSLLPRASASASRASAIASALSQWAARAPAWQRDVASHKPIWQAAAALGSPAVAWAIREWGRLLLAADSQLVHLFGSKRCPAKALELHALWKQQPLDLLSGGADNQTQPAASAAPEGCSPLHPPNAADPIAFNSALWSRLHTADVFSITATWPSQSCTSRAGSATAVAGSPPAWAEGATYATPKTLGVPPDTPLWMACRVDSSSVSDCALAYLAGGLLHDTQRALSLLPAPAPAAARDGSGNITMLDVALAAEAELAPQDRRAYTRAVAEAARPASEKASPSARGTAPHTPEKGTLEQLEDALDAGAGATPAALRVSRVLGSALGGAARTLVAATSGAALLPPAAALQRLVDDVFCPARVGAGMLQGLGGADKEALQGHPWGVKAAPPMGLAARLAMSAAALPGLSSVAILWRMAVASMRARWDDAISLPHMPTEGKGGSDAGLPPLPDHSASLLHQKLQLLQACIVHRAALRARHGGVQPAAGITAAQASGEKGGKGGAVAAAAESGEGWDTEFDSDEDLEGSLDSGSHNSFATGSEGGEGGVAGAAKLPVSDALPTPSDGTAAETQLRATVIPGMFLCDGGEPMAAPVTLADAAEYGCEDSLLQQAALLARLGAGADGARVRARLQTAGLRSDMSAFKAANPGCSLLDFVRWHSPRDWVGDISSHPNFNAKEGGVYIPSKAAGAAPRLVSLGEELPASEAAKCTSGHLSTRMQGSGGASTPSNSARQDTLGDSEGAVPTSHVWHVSWADAPPLAAHEQPPPIDITGEGEKVLHFLETMPPAELMLQLSALQLQCSAWLMRCATDGMLQLGDEAPSAGVPSAGKVAQRVLQQFDALQKAVDRASALSADAVLNSTVQGVMGSAEDGKDSPVDVAAGDMHRALAAMGDAIPHLADCETQVARLSALLSGLGGAVGQDEAAGTVALAAALLDPEAVYPAGITHPKAQHELLWACVNRAAEAGTAAKEQRRREVTAAAAAAGAGGSGGDSDSQRQSTGTQASLLRPLEELPHQEAAQWVAKQLAGMGSRQSPAMWEGCSCCTLQLQNQPSGFAAAAVSVVRSAVQLDWDAQREQARAVGQHAQWSNAPETRLRQDGSPVPIKVEVVCTSNEPCTMTGNSSLGAPPLPEGAAHRLYVEAKQTGGQAAVARRSHEGVRDASSAYDFPSEDVGTLDGLRIALVQSQWLA